MEKMIAYCGFDCTKCSAYIAKKENDDELRIRSAKEWSQGGYEVFPDKVNCDECLSTTGELIDYCNICDIRTSSAILSASSIVIPFLTFIWNPVLTILGILGSGLALLFDKTYLLLETFFVVKCLYLKGG